MGHIAAGDDHRRAIECLDRPGNLTPDLDIVSAGAKAKNDRNKVKVRLRQMDVQNLEFGDNSFHTVVASFVFCSVPDPVRGLQEARRVCRPGGKVILLEHVLSTNRVLARLMNLVNPLAVRMMGANINRKTVDNVAGSGLTIEKVTDLGGGIFKLIEARKTATPS